MSSSDLPLGRTENGKKVYIDHKTRSTHMQIIGSSGEGKSKFMEHMIREDILERNGLCLIDPHGYLYNDIVTWAETHHLMDEPCPRQIVLFDPSEAGWAFGFNPLDTGSCDESSIPYHVDAMVKAVAKVWGGEDTDRTPLLKRCLRVLFHALAEKRLSLLEAGYLLDRVDKTVRSYLTRDLKSHVIRQEWDYFNTLTPKQFYDEFGSTINRMVEFLHAPAVCNVIGQTENTLNFSEMMDEGRVLLVNLASADRISEDNARLLGTLIVNDLFMKAKGRPKGSRPFYLYIDECALFINEDIKRILDEGRKFGLHLILAHQHLAQLRKAGEDIYHAVMTDAKTKVIFGGLNTEDARVLTEQIFLGELDLEEAKVTLNKPVVTGYIRTLLDSYSEGTGVTRGQASSFSEGEGRSSSSMRGKSRGISLQPLRDWSDFVYSFSRSDAEGESVSASWSITESESNYESETRTHGQSETLEPVLRTMPSQVYSLEEQIHKAMVSMVNQPMQHAIIKLPKKSPAFVRTPTVDDGWANDDRVARFKLASYEKADFIAPKAAIEERIRERHARIEAAANGFAKGSPQGGGEQDDKEDFYE